jgi:ABC-2 type transport system permease protein
MNIAWLQWRALCKKEWRVAIDTPLAYVIAIAFLIASGFFFSNNLFLIGQADMRGWFSVLALLLMFFIPAMSMRMLADERRSGTFELLATMPVKTIDIVMGKYLALCTQIFALLALTWLYPLSLLMLGNVDMGQVAACYVAAILLASLYAAVCLYASALSRYEVVAYIIGFIMLLMLFLISQAVSTFPVFVQDWVVWISPLSHYQSMLRGLLRLSDVLFFVAISVIFLSLTWFALERRRWR